MRSPGWIPRGTRSPSEHRTDDGRIIGWAEVLDEHPRDGVPWIGLLEVHQQEQRKGYGAEAIAALVEWARSADATALRLGVDEGNHAGFAFGLDWAFAWWTIVNASGQRDYFQ